MTTFKNRRSFTTLLIGSAAASYVAYRSVRTAAPSGAADRQRNHEAQAAVRLSPLPAGLVESHLAKADQQIIDALEGNLAPLRQTFAKAYQGVPEFAEVALGWTSQMKWAWDILPGTANIRLRDYLRAEFERLVLDPANLDKAVNLSVVNFTQQIRSFENQMLVALKADIEKIDGRYPIAKLDASALQPQFEVAIKLAAQASQDDLMVDAAQLVVAAIIERIVKKLAERCMRSVATNIGRQSAVRGAVYAGASASAPWSLGASLAVTLILDLLISWIWDWFYDPHGELESQLKRQLDLIQHQIIYGVDGNVGLRTDFMEVAEARALLRRTVIDQFL